MCNRRTVWIATGILLFGGAALADQALTAAERPVQLDVKAQPMVDALNQFARQAGLRIVFYTEVAKGVTAPRLVGTYTPDAALRELLRASDLEYTFKNAGTVEIHSARQSTDNRPSSEPLSTSVMRVAQAGTGSSSAAVASQSSTDKQSGSSPGADTEGAAFEEIIVTAQKRSERLQDVPIPVSTVSTDRLIESNQVLLRDFYTSVPGLSLAPRLQSQQTLSIRGVSTGLGNPTVGITVDDMPYGASTENGGGRSVPDIDPGDLQRVEVLRGPQGTLYGASSMGGLMKFVTRDPSTDAVTGRIQVGVNHVENGSDPGYSVRGSVNLPITDTLAMSVSGFHRYDAGYIDDPARNAEDLNRANANGGRLAALWRPSDAFSLKLSALYQKIEGDGSSDVYVLPGLDKWDQSTLRNTGWYDRKAQSYIANITAKLGRVDLTSVSGYNINTFNDSFDYSFGLGPTMQSLFGVGGAAIVAWNETRKFTQELRFAIPVSSRLDWLVGAFYTYEDSKYRQDLAALDPASGVQVGSLRDTRFPSTFEEYAAFTDLTFHITDRFDLQVGGRQSQFDQTSQTTRIAGGVSTVDPEAEAKLNAFTYLVTPQFKISPDMMVYARLASGYRAGGLNVSVGVPPTYDPDKTQNYEIGAKGSFFDRRLMLDASVYYIDWKDIQLNLIVPLGSYITNTSSAKAQGVELSAEVRPKTGLTIAAWVAYNDAKLTADFPATSTAFGFDGDRLPYSSRVSGNFSIDQEFPLSAQMTGFAGGSVSYVDNRLGVFWAGTTREPLPAYTKVDLRAGVRYDSWTANLFVTNATDERGLLAGGLGSFPPYGYSFIQPRTVGLTLTKSF